MSIDIESHEFKDEDVHAQIEGDEVWLVATAYSAVNKSDVIALAKHFKLTAHDIDCQAIKDMQDEIDLADDMHFDELVECKTTVMKHNKGIN